MEQIHGTLLRAAISPDPDLRFRDLRPLRVSKELEISLANDLHRGCFCRSRAAIAARTPLLYRPVHLFSLEDGAARKMANNQRTCHNRDY